ncbi:Glu-tRNA(Gln) amidotransferase subunit GatE [Candidatus Woesearchaeota archaeon]|nr:Glu-tRNA(Gln) amidotransferase subunit GatE [Candidatus Woesearchaeota archaeon]
MDWNALGLRCGLEIHQQLNTLKLFCNCPSAIRDDEPHYRVTRKLRAVAGESGEIDIAAAQETQKQKTSVYEGYDTTCLVELDEEPPHQLNAEALRAALQISKMFSMRVADNVRVMRKTVVDGSNTSGFQRTALISHSGKLQTSQGEIGILSLCLEEDACRIIKDEQGTTVFRLDRLGIPLIELATSADIHSPEHAAEVAETIGLALRSTGTAKRGLGTIRQDLNVSITGGTRIEIKGAQDLSLVSSLVQTEALRQKALLEIRDELAGRKASVGHAVIDVTDSLRSSQSKLVQKTFQAGGVALGMLLPGFEGIIGEEIQPGKRLGTEFSERAKTIAGVGGILHSDELPAYGITGQDVEAVRQKLGNQAFVLVLDQASKAERAITAVRARAQEALRGVPPEVRKANDDGTTSYLRPMPGAARMYPETDIPAITITESMLVLTIPESIPDRIMRYAALGFAKDLAELAGKSGKSQMLDRFIKAFPNIKPAYIAETLLTSERTIKRQFNIEIQPSDDDYEQLFAALANRTLSKEAVLDVLKEGQPVASVLPKYSSLSEDQLRHALHEIVAANPGLPFNALIGKAMQKLRGKASGSRIAELLKLAKV